MADTEDLDRRLTTGIRSFADASLADFDADRVASAAMAARERRSWWTVATAAAAVLVVATAAVLAVPRSEDPSAGADGDASPLASVEASQAPPSAPATSAPASASAALTEQQAIAAAREAAPHAADYPEVLVAEAGPFGKLFGPEGYDFDAPPPADRWVWRITLCRECGPLQGDYTTVVIDYLDGRIYGVFDAIG